MMSTAVMKEYCLTQTNLIQTSKRNPGVLTVFWYLVDIDGNI